MTLRTVLVAAVVPSVVSQNQGSDGACIGSRFHKIDYDYSDETDENGMPKSFHIEIEPKPEESSNCLPTNGGTDKAVCVGMNTDDCRTAAKVVQIKDYLDCEECFMGLTTDLFYNVTVEGFSLKDVKVGIRDSHLQGKSVLHFKKQGSQTAAQGTLPLVNNEIQAKIKLQAGPIPVNIKFQIPTTLEYDVELSESAEVHLGGAVDVNLGDHFLSWSSEEGFGTTSSNVGVTWTPTIVADGQVTADVPLTIKSTLAVEFENVLSWNVHLTPALPLHASLKSSVFSGTKVCLSGEGDFLANHDADVHFNFAGFHHTFATFGPAEIYHKHWSSVFNKCVSTGAEEDVVV